MFPDSCSWDDKYISDWRRGGTPVISATRSGWAVLVHWLWTSLVGGDPARAARPAAGSSASGFPTAEVGSGQQPEDNLK